MLKPLDDVQRTIALIAAVSGSSQTEVRERLIAESAEIGTNVNNGMKSQNIPMHVVSSKLDDFYRESDAFIYDSTVCNCCRAKERMRHFVSSRLQQFDRKQADIFCFGDGLGFDSAHLALCGHRVKYFEPSLRCQEFSKQVFEDNGVVVANLESLEDIKPHSLDAIVCLDVLEHVPQPDEFVKQFQHWLKPDGLLFVHAPFWCVHWTKSTHLRENLHFSGDLERLYQANGFEARDASVFWDPIVLQRSEKDPIWTVPMAARIRIAIGMRLLRFGRRNNSIHVWVARRIAKPPKHWVAALLASCVGDNS
ncbi:MAG: methyltransferase domain-containing protein [Planctomycetota bacterium]|nr:methyltransferase domain-containing protein [Planctomycetota bacterium]